MILEARLQAAIEILGDILSKNTPADQLMTNYFRQRRYIGGSDRREISRFVYGVLRQYFYLAWLLNHQPTPRLLVFSYVMRLDDTPGPFELGGKYAPEPLTPHEAILLQRLSDLPPPPKEILLNMPPQALPYLKQAYPDTWEALCHALNREATFDIRVNTLKCTRKQVLEALYQEGVEATPTDLSPWGVRLGQRRPLSTSSLWHQGWIEVQDEGSQLLALAVHAQPGETILDLCAGAGGKTLALAMMMENKGKIYATDVVNQRLLRAKERLQRAGVHNTEIKLLDTKGLKWLERQENRFDRVLIDAPCSGSGTWRRNPDQKIRFQAQDLQELMIKQQALLDQAFPLVKPGGYLYYATCSLFAEENAAQVTAFLAKHPDFTCVSQQQYTPLAHQCDGFFMATFSKSGENG